MTTANPVADSERILFWDVLRGIAVLGVLLANMPLMSFGEALLFDPRPLGPETGTFDHLAFGFVRIFADTKFITIFSILFGAGLGIMSEKALEDGDRPFAGLYLRRLGLLALIGLVHGNFIWFGDILFHYALVGCAALLFRRISVRGLVTIAAVLLGLCFFWNLLVMSAMAFKPEPAAGVVVESPEVKAAALDAVFSSGDFARMLARRSRMVLEGMVFMSLLWGLRTLGLFLVGMALVRSGLFVDAESRRPLFRRVALLGLALGLPLSALWLWVSYRATAFGGGDPSVGLLVLNSALSYLCALFQSPAYIALAALWATSGVLLGLRARLAAVGRMALTNYLSHSVITALIFNYGGLFGQWGRGRGLLLCFAIFAFQLVVSPLWLRHFRFGPLEWLWRTATYGRRQPMRRTKLA